MDHLKLYSLQYLRGIAAIVVALYHFIPIVNVLLEKHDIELKLIQYWGYLGVDLFFVISGFVIWLTTRKINIGKLNANHVWIFLKKRLIRVYSLYWLIFIPWLIILIKIHFVHIQDMDLLDYFRVIFLLPYQEQVHPLPASWTLTYELLFYICFSTLLWLTSVQKRLCCLKSTLFIILLINILLYIVLEKRFFDLGIWSILISPYFIEFILGCLICEFFLQNKLILSRKKVIAYLYLLLISLFFMFLIFSIYKIDIYQFPLIRVFLFGGLFSLLLFLMVKIEFINNSNKANRILLVLGNASYSIYLLHTIIFNVLFAKFSLIIYIVNWVKNLNVTWILILSILYFIFMLLCSIIFSLLFEHPLYQFLIKKFGIKKATK